MSIVYPYLQWPGGKSQLVPILRELLPPGRRLIEPFVGAGAVFLNTDYPAYLMGDINGDLVLAHQMLQAHGDAFIEACRALFVPQNNTPERYTNCEMSLTTQRIHGARQRSSFTSTATASTACADTIEPAS